MINKYIEEALKIANRSTHRKHMMGCVIVQNDKIIANGWSHEGTWRMRELYWMHAEHHALVRTRYMRGKFDNAILYIACIARKSGNIVEAKPCISCATALLHAGINQVVYTETPWNKDDPYNFYQMSLYQELDSLKRYPSPYDS